MKLKHREFRPTVKYSYMIISEPTFFILSALVSSRYYYLSINFNEKLISLTNYSKYFLTKHV